MDIIFNCCAGLDVHQASVVAALRDSRTGKWARKETRTFGTTTRELEAMRDWLLGEGVSVVAMESTGVFWKPIFNVLEEHFPTLLLCNAQHLKRVPGRKTDVSDAEWIAQLLQAGLLSGSFVPDRTLRDLRDLNRARVQVRRTQSEVVNRLHKVLQDANIKLTTCATDIMGASGRAMLEAIAQGEHDPAETAELARRRMRNKIPQLREALRGHVRDHHRWMIRRYLAQYDAHEAEIAQFDARIAALMSSTSPPPPEETPEAPSAGETPSETPREAPEAAPAARHQQATSADPRPVTMAEARALLLTLPGVGELTAERVLAEIGTDMSRFPTAGHLASWAGLCPGSSSSAGKSKGSKTRKGSSWLRSALNQAAWAAARKTGSYFNAAFRRWSARRGAKRAIVAVAHALLRAIYAMLKRRTPYRELGGDWFDQLRPERAIRSLNRRLNKLGYEAVPIAREAAV